MPPQESVTVRRPIAIVGAASNIGIRPYDNGREPRHLDRAPDTLRELGLTKRLAAVDLGDVTPRRAYEDFIRPPGGIRNEDAVTDYSHSLAERVSQGVRAGRFMLVLGGDCSIVLGSLLGARSRAPRVGLAYVDAHADFATPAESQTGSAASMCLGLAIGRGDTPLARLAGATPLVRADDVVLVGRRDEGQTYYGHAALRASGILDMPDAAVSAAGPEATAASAIERLTRAGVDGFWIHVDVDVLDPQVMPAVDSPEPGGPDVDRLAALLTPLVTHPGALGMQVTIYDPALDTDRSCGARLVGFLETLLAPPRTLVSRPVEG